MLSNHTGKGQSSQIDKTSPLPYHYQLREIIRQEIALNRWKRGEQLPSEHQLCEMYEVSRTTVREALDALVSEGLLIREKGLGTFVTDPKYMESWSGSAIGFSDSLTQQGVQIDTRVLDLRITAPNPHVQKELNLSAKDEVYYLKRLRYIAKLPILVVDSYIPVQIFPNLMDIDFTTRSLYQTFRDVYDAPVFHVKRVIEAIAADEAIAEYLDLSTGFPIMYIENTAYIQDGTPIEYYTAWRRGDKSRFQFEYSVP